METKRLSNFLLWQCAYAELYFTDIKCQIFHDEFFKILDKFSKIDRRFGTSLKKINAGISYKDFGEYFKLKDLPRIISAIVLIGLVYLSVAIGRFAVFFLICLFSFLVLWELGNNFFKLKTFPKMINHVVMGLASYVCIYAVENQYIESKVLLGVGGFFNLLFLVYLFNKSKKQGDD